jgi:nitric oxide dioxygenase
MLDCRKKIVQSTEPVIREHRETITRVFYRHLREEHFELASMFNARDQSDGNQARDFAAVILAYASNTDRLPMSTFVPSSGRSSANIF